MQRLLGLKVVADNVASEVKIVNKYILVLRVWP